MHDTRISLNEETRTKSMQLLNARLADAIDLAMQLKLAHWNIRGPHFLQLHELFDKITESVREHVDMIAERIGALGGIAHGSLQSVASNSGLDSYPEDVSSGIEHTKLVASALAKFGGAVRENIEQASSIGDAATEDLLTEIVRDIDQHMWFVEAHLQAES
ncbi:DNA protection during starvation protein [Maioricimonas rarisocia]|uniref:DNA protection during starvation protein n=1 Tax=Maioricimonas rarisocia TaxID=2528026 RepID=A0A517Z7T2_9PLAN|nr:DNA starvation/stationary phase protection protein Dps [Maioricimonas rarisocia]QDU38537.1 DNA protection during starvation protein [Maioricimonas rarisocia]